MSHIKIIDVTLRDGGYRNNFNFSTTYARDAIVHLIATGVPYCEIGYRNGPYARQHDQGPTSRVSPEYLSALHDAADGRIDLCVMVHPHNVGAADFEMLRQHGASMIRVCLRHDRAAEGMATLQLAKSFGFTVSANITHITSMAPGDISDICLRAEGAGADVLAFADSNGNMIPADVDRLISRVSSRVLIPLGFHAHNNLSLALSNSIAAINAGAEYIDASVCGMGKGAGNLHLSMLIGYLHRAGINNDYDLVSALQLSQLTADSVVSSSLPAPLVDVMMGTYNLPFDVQHTLDTFIETHQSPSRFHALQSIHEQRSRKAGRSFHPTPVAPPAQVAAGTLS